jgi:hypothetical protein
MILMLIILGQAGGNEHSNKGGGTNYLCLPNDPDNGEKNNIVILFLNILIIIHLNTKSIIFTLLMQLPE